MVVIGLKDKRLVRGREKLEEVVVLKDSKDILDRAVGK